MEKWNTKLHYNNAILTNNWHAYVAIVNWKKGAHHKDRGMIYKIQKEIQPLNYSLLKNDIEVVSKHWI